MLCPPPPPEFRWLSTSTENKDCTAQFCTQFNIPNYSSTLSSGFPSFQEVLCSFFCTDQYFVSLLHTCPLFWLFFFFFNNHFPLSFKQTMTFVRRGEPVSGSEFKSYSHWFSESILSSCVYVCMYVCVCVCIYIYIYTLNRIWLQIYEVSV